MPPHNKGKGISVTWLRDHANYKSNDCLDWQMAWTVPACGQRCASNPARTSQLTLAIS